MSDLAAPEPYSTAPAVERAEGETRPDFSTIGLKTESQTPTPEPESTPTPTPEPKPEVKPEVKEPAPEPEKAKEEAKEPAKTEEAKPETTKAKEPKLLSEEEIEALSTKKGVPETIIKSFNEMKGLLGFATKAAKQRATEIETMRAELEEARKQTLPPETVKELEDLRAFRQTWDTENTPEFQERVQGKFTTADKAFFDILKGEELGLDEEGEKLVRANIDGKYNPKWLQENILDPIADPILRRQVENALIDRVNASKHRDAEVASLQENRVKIRGEIQEQQKKAEQEWVDKARGKTNELATKYGDSWAAFKPMPENASPEQKAAVDKFNAEVKHRAGKFQETIAKVWGRDPELTTEVIFKSFHADHVDSLLKQKEEELASKIARITELEDLIAASKNSGRQNSIRQAASDNDEKIVEKPVRTSGDARAAISEFFDNR